MLISDSEKQWFQPLLLLKAEFAAGFLSVRHAGAFDDESAETDQDRVGRARTPTRFQP